RPHGDAVGLRVEAENGELGERAAWGDAPDLVPESLRKPEVAIRPEYDFCGPAVRGGDGREEVHGARSTHGADPVATEVCEPEVAVRSRRDTVRCRSVPCRERCDHPGGCDPVDRVPTV